MIESLGFIATYIRFFLVLLLEWYTPARTFGILQFFTIVLLISLVSAVNQSVGRSVSGLLRGSALHGGLCFTAQEGWIESGWSCEEAVVKYIILISA